MRKLAPRSSMVELAPHKGLVAGSSPAGATMQLTKCVVLPNRKSASRRLYRDVAALPAIRGVSERSTGARLGQGGATKRA